MGQYVQNPDGTHSQQTVLTGRKLKYQRVRQTAVSAIAASGSSTINIFATPGYIARLKYAGVFMPAIAGATGSQLVTISVGASAYGAEQISSGSGANGAAVTLKYESPSNISFDSVNPLSIVFNNTTNLPTDGTTARLYIAIYEEEAIAP